MRRWFVVLLIVLLPWRAWAGDAMLLSMAVPTPDQAVTATSSVMAATPHCADHAAADPAGPDAPAPHAVCDICNGPLLAAAPWAAPGADAAPSSRMTGGPVRFASALPHPGHKPPIS